MAQKLLCQTPLRSQGHLKTDERVQASQQGLTPGKAAIIGSRIGNNCRFAAAVNGTVSFGRTIMSVRLASSYQYSWSSEKTLIKQYRPPLRGIGHPMFWRLRDGDAWALSMSLLTIVAVAADTWLR
jgi:hypothetical protein